MDFIHVRGKKYKAEFIRDPDQIFSIIQLSIKLKIGDKILYKGCSWNVVSQDKSGYQVAPIPKFKVGDRVIIKGESVVYTILNLDHVDQYYETNVEKLNWNYQDYLKKY